MLASVDNGDDRRVLSAATTRACDGARPTYSGAGGAWNERAADGEVRRHPSRNEVAQYTAAAPFSRGTLVAGSTACRTCPHALSEPRAVIDGGTGRNCSG